MPLSFPCSNRFSVVISTWKATDPARSHRYGHALLADTIARFHTRLKLVWGQTDVGKGWLASQPWPAAVGRPCAAVRFLASDRTEMLFSLIELSARGSTLKARWLPPAPPLPHPDWPLPPLSFLSFLHPHRSSSLSRPTRPASPLPSVPLFFSSRWILPDRPCPFAFAPLTKARVSTSPASWLCRVNCVQSVRASRARYLRDLFATDLGQVQPRSRVCSQQIVSELMSITATALLREALRMID